MNILCVRDVAMIFQLRIYTITVPIVDSGFYHQRRVKMNGELNKDYYCQGYVNKNHCEDYGLCEKDLDHMACGYFHHKWPTPEQFREEYGEEYPDDGAVYWTCIVAAGKEPGWNVDTYSEAKKEIKNTSGYSDISVIIVCACTPWGCPPDDWRSE